MTPIHCYACGAPMHDGEAHCPKCNSPSVAAGGKSSKAGVWVVGLIVGLGLIGTVIQFTRDALGR